MDAVSDVDARRVYEWYHEQGVSFKFGEDKATELTEAQVLAQCRMYVAAVRLADERGCAAVRIAGQPGWAESAPSSGLVEGTLNNVERPPVGREGTGEELFAGEALPCFHAGDECAGLDGLVTYRLWRELGYPPENTSHLLRWGRDYRDDAMDAYVWGFPGGWGSAAGAFRRVAAGTERAAGAGARAVGRRDAQGG